VKALAELVWSRARNEGSRTAVVTRGERVSLSRLVERAEALALELAARLSAHPARALVRSRDPFEVLVFVLGCWRADCSAVVLHEATPAESVARIGRRLGASALLQDGHWSGPCAPAPRPPDPREALVLATSGTSGAPRLVALPGDSALVNTRAIAAELGLDEQTRLLVAQPLSRAYGLVGACLTGLRSGAEIHLEPGATPPPVLQRAIRERELTVVQGAPAFFQLFMQYWNGKPFPSVRVWTTGGELASRELLGSLRRAFPRARGRIIFGMTELGPRISHAPAEDPRVLRGFIGRPFDHIDWRIEAAQAADAPGRLRLRGSAAFLGYVAKDGGYEGIDPDGYFTSPDLVSRDADGVGLVYHGRHDQLFKVGGHIVNPALVEQTLVALPGVADARCYPEPDPILGQVVIAEIVAAPELRDETLLAACRSALDPPSVPRRMRRVQRTERVGAADKRARPLRCPGAAEPGSAPP
jgi:acyl-CoA synthetase (AMP-forming)/AMP-acid ligase II